MGTVVAAPAGGTQFADDDHIVYQVCATTLAGAVRRAPSFATYQRDMRERHRLKRTTPLAVHRFGGEACRVERYNVRTAVKDIVRPIGANFIEAGGGTIASWLGTSDPNAVGITIVDALQPGLPTIARFPNSGLGPVSPDGAVAFKVDYQSWGPWDVYERTGARWRLTDGDAVNINLLGKGRAFFVGFAGPTSIGIPGLAKLLPGSVWWIRVVEIQGEWWILYQHENGKLVFHPFTSTVGYELAPPNSLTYRPDVIHPRDAPVTTVRVVWASREDEGPDVQHAVDVDTTRPRIELNVIPPPPPVCGLVYVRGDVGTCSVCGHPKSEHQQKDPVVTAYRDGASDVQPLLQQAWTDLDVDAKTRDITNRRAVTADERHFLKNIAKARREGRKLAHPSPRTADLEEEYKAVQVPAVIEAAGQAHHTHGWHDVGLSTKNAGNHYTLPDGRNIAGDIITLKDLNGGTEFVLVDCMTASGSPDAHPTWNVLGPNADGSRPWAAPPTPSGSSAAPLFSFDDVIVVGGKPDIRRYAETTSIKMLDIRPDGVALTFDKQASWPDHIDPGAGDTQYTLWFGMFVENHWHAVGCIQYWKGLAVAGGDILHDDQIAKHWTYFALPMDRQPAVGEPVAFFVTQGNTRHQNELVDVHERSNAVTIPFPSSHQRFTFDTASDGTHKYDGGGHDTGTCDRCGQSRFADIHKIPQSKERHDYDGGEQDTGLCDICQTDRSNALHQKDDGGGGVANHTFVGSGNFCSACGRPKDDPIHQVSSGGGGSIDLTETNQVLHDILAEQKSTTAAINNLREAVVKGIKDFGTTILPLLGGLITRKAGDPESPATEGQGHDEETTDRRTDEG